MAPKPDGEVPPPLHVLVDARMGPLLQVRAPCGLVFVGLLSSTRLKMLKNSARISSDIFSRTRNVRPIFIDSDGRRAYR